MKTRCGIAAVILGLAPMAICAQEEIKVTGQVVDAAGKPVAGVEVSRFWLVENGKMKPHKGATTNAEGRFALPITFYGRSEALLALDKDRKMGGLIVAEPKEATKPLTIKLVPLVHLHGKFDCKELNKRPKWTNVYIMSGQARFAMCSSEQASFSFHLPPGTYRFWGYGTDIQNLKKDITLKAGEPEFDLGTIDMAATVIARHKGKAPPAWHVTDARGVKKDVKISDFKGKWVLLEFWGYW
ncbi:MAG TPA: hypothetical protein VMF69_21580 [Gemmataceae bacterium]|nr:hypothetical protein [Gemmataceae bacterium]